MRSSLPKFIAWVLVTFILCWCAGFSTDYRQMGVGGALFAPFFLEKKPYERFCEERIPLAGSLLILGILALLVVSGIAGWTKPFDAWYERWNVRSILSGLLWVVWIWAGYRVFIRQPVPQPTDGSESRSA